MTRRKRADGPTRPVSVRFTAAEHARVARCAQHAGLDVSAWIRWVSLGATSQVELVLDAGIRRKQAARRKLQTKEVKP